MQRIGQRQADGVADGKRLLAFVGRRTSVAILTLGCALVLCACTGGGVNRSAGISGGSGIVVSHADIHQVPGTRDNLARLTGIGIDSGTRASTVELHFQPGRRKPTTTIRRSKDPVVRSPGTGKPVKLAGSQAVRITLSHMASGWFEPVVLDDPIIAEVRMLGFFEGRTVLGIGIHATADIRTRASLDTDRHVLEIALRQVQ